MKMPEYEVKVIVKRAFPVWMTIEAENEDEAQDKAVNWDYIEIRDDYEPLTEGKIEIDEVRKIAAGKQQQILAGGK
jgi:hypothetical protein